MLCTCASSSRNRSRKAVAAPQPSLFSGLVVLLTDNIYDSHMSNSVLVTWSGQETWCRCLHAWLHAMCSTSTAPSRHTIVPEECTQLLPDTAQQQTCLRRQLYSLGTWSTSRGLTAYAHMGALPMCILASGTTAAQVAIQLVNWSICPQTPNPETWHS